MEQLHNIRMNFRAVLACLCLGLCFLICSPATVFAKAVAILQSSDIHSYNRATNAFIDHLSQEVRPVHSFSLKGNVENGRTIAQHIRSLNVDLVVAVGLKAALVVKQELAAVPSIFCMVLNPGKYNLTQSNMAGIALEIPFADHLQSLQYVLPKIQRIGVIYNPIKTGKLVARAHRQAQALGVKLVPRRVASEKDVPAMLRDILPHIEALWLLPDSTVLTTDSFNFLLRTTLDANVPVIGFSPDLVSKGALLSVHFNFEDVGKQAARIAEGFLNGNAFTAGRIISPHQLRFAINLKTANFLGLNIPPDVLTRFHEMY